MKVPKKYTYTHPTDTHTHSSPSRSLSLLNHAEISAADSIHIFMLTDRQPIQVEKQINKREENKARNKDSNKIIINEPECMYYHSDLIQERKKAGAHVFDRIYSIR